VVAPCSKLGCPDWWATTAADRFTKIPTRVLDHRRFWDAMAAVNLTDLAEIERRLALRMIEVFGLDASAVALLSHAYPGNKPDVTQFPTMLAELGARHQAVAGPSGASSAMTVVFDAGTARHGPAPHQQRPLPGSDPHRHPTQSIRQTTPGGPHPLANPPRWTIQGPGPDPGQGSFSPMHHWTDHNIRVHTQTCVFALMVAHLMRRQADQAGQHLSDGGGRIPAKFMIWWSFTGHRLHNSTRS
jgi:hypothetical protein